MKQVPEHISYGRIVDLTMNAHGAIEATRAFNTAILVPAHIDGWAHFSEYRAEVARNFAQEYLTN